MTQVTLTQEETERRLALNERRRNSGSRRRRGPIPQAVLDLLLPNIEVISYVDADENPLGECWRWKGGADPATGLTPRGTVDGRWKNIRRVVAERMRAQPIPASWVATVDCETELCVHPRCCCALPRSKAIAVWQGRGQGLPDHATRVRRATAGGRAVSPLTPERVQRMREDYEEMKARGVRGICEQLGKSYGVAAKSAQAIVHGRRWVLGGAEIIVPQRRVASVFDLGRLA
jgi:hypothetical protein